ncbi:MAG TPA: DUF6599 family protein [Blastocatellia bacterium]|nr:DUF6599 family protein [Blastocatellia bacterium]
MRKRLLSLLTAALILAAVPGAGAGQDRAEAGDGQSVTVIAAPPRVSESLADRLAGVKATSEIRQFGRDNLAELVTDQAQAFQEYRVVSALSRQYGLSRADLFIIEDRFAAFGLASYLSGTDGAILYKGNCLVRVTGAAPKKGAGDARLRARMAQEIAAAIEYVGQDDSRPPLLDSLPRESIVERSERYFLGPASIGAYVQHGRDMIGFAGDAEAVMAEYKDTDGDSLRLVIVEYHTPPFATEAFQRMSDYISSLSDEERSRFILKREGNYIVQAMNVEDREFAERVVGAVKYPYTVKWLRDPLLPTNDPFRQRKAAEMLLSTFGILGLILMTVLVAGGTFGAIIFLKRRKQQREIFSDAGGMLRLELDPFEATILGLPPPSSGGRDQGAGIRDRGSMYR